MGRSRSNDLDLAQRKSIPPQNIVLGIAMELSIHMIAEFHDQLTSTTHVLLTSKETIWSLQDHIMLATIHKSLVFLISCNRIEFLIKTNKICDYDEFSKILLLNSVWKDQKHILYFSRTPWKCYFLTHFSECITRVHLQWTAFSYLTMKFTSCTPPSTSNRLIH